MSHMYSHWDISARGVVRQSIKRPITGRKRIEKTEEQERERETEKEQKGTNCERGIEVSWIGKIYARGRSSVVVGGF